MKLLKTTMVLNSSSCIIFGILFLAASDTVNSFIGNSFSWLTPVVGAVLVFNGCHLLLASKRNSPICPEILYFVLGDFAWVIASIIFIMLGMVITSVQGIIVALLIASMVGLFGVLQVLGYKKLCTAG